MPDDQADEIFPHAKEEERTLYQVFLAARQPHGTSAAASAGPREDDAAATVTQLPSGARPPDKAAA